MIYFDTNVLVYFSIDQDPKKLDLARRYIFEAIEKEQFFISTLVMSEYIFVLSKLQVLAEQSDKVEFFFHFAKDVIHTKAVEEAYGLCREINDCRKINDAIHCVAAARHCRKLVTFDKDYKKFGSVSLEIEILS